MTIDSEPGHPPFLSILANLTVRTEQEHAQLSRLTELLRRSRLSGDLAEFVPRRLSSDRSPAATAEADAAHQALIARLAAAEEPAYRVFRREAPAGAPALGAATP